MKKTYKRAEIAGWLEEYASDPNNHFDCDYDKGKVIACACDLGPAWELHKFIHDKLKIEELDD